MNTGSRIFVAGHRGLLGSAVVRKLRAEGYANILVRTRQELDLLDQHATYELLEREKPEYVFLCAARVGGIRANIESPASFLCENLQIQCNVIEGARRAGTRRLLFVASSCIYPRDAPNPIRESSLLTGSLEPTNEGYALAKIAGIRMCEYYRREHGCDFISAIPCNLFGPGDRYDLALSHLVPALILKLHRLRREGKDTLDVWGSGRPRREFMLSDDCADALLFIMRNWDEGPVNVGVGTDLSILEIAEAVARAMGVQARIRLDPSQPDGMPRKLLDVSRLHARGWSPRASFEEGVRIAYRDFLERGLE